MQEAQRGVVALRSCSAARAVSGGWHLVAWREGEGLGGTYASTRVVLGAAARRSSECGKGCRGRVAFGVAMGGVRDGRVAEAQLGAEARVDARVHVFGATCSVVSWAQ